MTEYTILVEHNDYGDTYCDLIEQAIRRALTDVDVEGVVVVYTKAEVGR